jgi:Protein of unknown function (DUF3043)
VFQSVFRRRNTEPETGTEPDGESGLPEDERPGSFTPAKGRPTPKRSEAERRRRAPYNPGTPAGRKAATSQSRDRDRTDRARKYEAMKRGEEWALANKDKGPVRALTRDYVDSKRRISEYYMYLLIVLFIALFSLRTASTKSLVYYVVVALAAIIIVEGTLISRGVRKLAATRFPGESTRGIMLYAIMRSMQIRRLRMPVPRVKPGDKI